MRVSALGLVFLAVAACAGRRPDRPTPNIVVIVFDDADADSFGAMPNIKRSIIDQGASFDRFYVTQPLCCPSRASLFTGEYVHNHGVLSNKAPSGGFRAFLDHGDEELTVARTLHDRGLAVGLFGKYLNQYVSASAKARTHRPPHWDRWFGKLDPDNNYELGFNDDGEFKRYVSRRSYSDLVVTGTALSWIEEMLGKRRSVFAYVAPLAPHTPLDDPPGHTTEFSSARLPSLDKPSFNEPDLSDKPRDVRRRPSLSGSQVRSLQSHYVHRLRRMLAVDDFVGDLVSTLKDDGQLDNTYIFVTSDNGWMQGEHRLVNGKVAPYEESIRVPLVVRGPGVVRGRNISALASMIDLYPTFAEIAGGRSDRDGRSLKPLLEGRSLPWRASILVESKVRWQRFPRYASIVTDRFKYTEWGTGEREFYDLSRDPYELRNLGAEADARAIGVMARRLALLEKCKGGSCRRADSTR